MNLTVNSQYALWKTFAKCHCEGAVGDCGNLNPHNIKTVYFLRRPEGL